MEMSKFAMYGKITAHKGERDTLVQMLLEAAKRLEAIQGCELYIVNVSDEDPDIVWVTELWSDTEAHAASLNNEDVRALIQLARPLIVGVEPIKLRSVGGNPHKE
jgi:quinol monooxygenase YgiN